MTRLLRTLRNISVGPRTRRATHTPLRSGFDLLAGDWRTRLTQESHDGRPDLRDVDFRGCTLDDLDLSACRLDRSIFDGATLNRVRLSNSDVSAASFVACSLQDARLDAVRGLDTRFDRATLRGSSFVAANLAFTSFRHSDLLRSNLSVATFLNADLRNASLRECARSMTDFEGADTTCIDVDVELETKWTQLAREAHAPSFAGALRHHMSFLHLNGFGAELALRAAEAAIENSTELQIELIGLLQSQRGWRAQTIVACAALLGGASEETLDAMWSAITVGSWASPQLLVAVSKLDPEFRERADRLAERSKVDPKTRGAISACLQQTPQATERVGFELASKWLARVESLTEPHFPDGSAR